MLMDTHSGNPCWDSAKHTALIVEDDPRLQRAMSAQLARMDFCVLVASHYEGAIRRLAEREPHVVCIDVGLPTKSGYDLCEYIRGVLGWAGLPILVTSEYASPQDMAYAEDAGGNAFLHKPFSMGQLAQCIESLANATPCSVPAVHELQALAWKPVSSRYVTNQRAERGLFAA
jgi:DNA-binding response OmpR family regulator